METALRSALEKIVSEALPSIAATATDEAAFEIVFTKREFLKTGSVQENISLLATVHADVEVVIFERENLDLTPLFKKVIKDNGVEIGGVFCSIELKESSVTEYDKMTVVVVKLSAIYPLVEIGEEAPAITEVGLEEEG